jgi:hypothetical protein
LTVEDILLPAAGVTYLTEGCVAGVPCNVRNVAEPATWAIFTVAIVGFAYLRRRAERSTTPVV